jgi:hypothetical protein
VKTEHLKLNLFGGSRLYKARKELSWCPDLKGVDNGKNLNHMVPIPSSQSFELAASKDVATL